MKQIIGSVVLARRIVEPRDLASIMHGFSHVPGVFAEVETLSDAQKDEEIGPVLLFFVEREQ